MMLSMFWSSLIDLISFFKRYWTQAINITSALLSQNGSLPEYGVLPYLNNTLANFSSLELDWLLEYVSLALSAQKSQL